MSHHHVVLVIAVTLAFGSGASAEKTESAPKKEITVTLPGGALMEMAWIPAGMFLMGSPDSDDMASDHEKPQHQVTITRGFYLAKHELTHGQYESVMGTYLGSAYARKSANHPLVGLTWNRVQALIARLNEIEQTEVYRLPTEAEWEYACRAGTTTRWFFGEDESLLGNYAWYEGNESEATDWNDEGWDVRVVGTRKPNPWGLYDMYGNVSEWVQDWYGPYASDAQVDPVGPASGRHRVLRGSYVVGRAYAVRSAHRGYYWSNLGDGLFGARLVRQEQLQANGTIIEHTSWGQIKGDVLPSMLGSWPHRDNKP